MSDSFIPRKIRVTGADGRSLMDFDMLPQPLTLTYLNETWNSSPLLVERPMFTMTQRTEIVPNEPLPALTERQQRHMDALLRLQLEKTANDMVGIPTHPVIQELMAELSRWVTMTDEELGREMAREMHDRMMERLSTPLHLEMPKGWMHS